MAASLLVPPLISMVEQKAAKYLLEQYEVMKGMEEQREKLKRLLQSIEAVITDAEEQVAHKPGVKNWLAALKSAAYEANDVLDDFSYEALRRQAKKDGHKIEKGVRNLLRLDNRIVFKYKMGRRLDVVVKRIDKLVDEMNKFGPVKNNRQVAALPWRQTDSVIDTNIVGRDQDKEKIVRWLLEHQVLRSSMQPEDEDTTVHVLPIIAMGGMGKTTLAQMVYNDQEVKEHFQSLLWVCISEEFDVASLAKKIIDVAIGGNCGLEKDNIEVLQQRLRKELGGKRYLLVLDDVWNEDADKWKKLKAWLGCGAAGSKIMATTRSGKVAEIMQTRDSYNLTQLADDDLLAIFQDKAFSRSVQKHPELLEIVKKIVEKCAGSPLAAKALGSLLSDKHDVGEWLAVLEKSNICDDKNGILPILRLSYDHLPPYMKQCFAFCAVFPKDHEMEIEMLVQLWMANSFVPPDDLEAKAIFTELAWRSFFQDIRRNGGITTCKMHDLMHDLATSIMGSECVCRSTSTKCDKLPSDVRHLSVLHGSSIDDLLNTNVDRSSPKIQTLLCLPYYKFQKVRNQLRLNSLRAMHLQQGIQYDPFLIKPGYLKHLRYLNFSDNDIIEELPEAMSTLYHLQTLKLPRCSRLRQLPKSTRYLSSLRHLYIDGCYELQCMPPGLGRLIYLQTLTYYIIGSNIGSDDITQIENLNLSGRLELYNLTNVRGAADARKANLSSKRKLTHLKLSWGMDTYAQLYFDENRYEELRSDNIEEVLEALKPYSGLEVLNITQYGGLKFSSWMEDYEMFWKLIELSLIDCRRCKKLPPVWQLPSLRVLLLKKMDGVQYICTGYSLDSRVGDEAFQSFPALEKLFLEDMQSLEGWQESEGKEVAAVEFPRLLKMNITNCPKLATLPRSPLLKELIVTGEMTVQFCLLAAIQSSLHSLRINLNRESTRNGSTSSSPVITGSSTLQSLILQRCDFFLSGQCESALAIWKSFAFLKYLEIFFCDCLVSWPEQEFQSLASLKNLHINYCRNLTGLSQEQLPPTPAPKQPLLPRLESLSIWNCPSLVQVFELPPSLKELRFVACPNLTTLSGCFNSLEKLCINNGESFPSLQSSLGSLPALKQLSFTHCKDSQHLSA